MLAEHHKKVKRPDWIRVKAPGGAQYDATKSLIESLKLNTVCQEAACPNIGECWSNKHATVMILGAVCTRGCRFCNVSTGKPQLLDEREPDRLAKAVLELGLQHVVITSVNRDDLEDGGAEHFARCISKIKILSPKTTVEVLTPDFLKKGDVVRFIVNAKPDVYNHNIETVPALYNLVRPGARYYSSLNLLHTVKKMDSEIFTKSGIMLGLGESIEEVIQVMDDLREAKVDFLIIGQYLQPTQGHFQVKRYATLEEFRYLERLARIKGFLMVSASPLTRSSYHAKEDFERLRLSRKNSFEK